MKPSLVLQMVCTVLCSACAFQPSVGEPASTHAGAGKADEATPETLFERLVTPPGSAAKERTITYVGRNASGPVHLWDQGKLANVPSEVAPGETCTLRFWTRRVSNAFVSSPFATGSLRANAEFSLRTERPVKGRNRFFDIGEGGEDFLSSTFSRSESHSYVDGPRGVYERVQRTRWFDGQERVLSLIEEVEHPTFFRLVFSTVYTDTLAVRFDAALTHPVTARFTQTTDDGQVAVIDCSDFVEVPSE